MCGNYGFISDFTDCYEPSGKVIRKIENESLFQRTQYNSWKKITKPNGLIAREFYPNLFEGRPISETHFNYTKYFENLNKSKQ